VTKSIIFAVFFEVDFLKNAVFADFFSDFRSNRCSWAKNGGELTTCGDWVM
jgi:hypothetical protein